MKKVSKNQAKELINSSKGKIFSVTFTKKNGETREMICRKGVKKHLKGGELMFDPNEKGLAVVFDMKKNAYRMININTLEKITVDKATYSVEQVAQLQPKETMKPIHIKSKAQQRHYRKPIRPIKYRNLKDIQDNEKSKDKLPI